MKRLLLVFGLLAACLNLFAIDFLGVELSGNVEDVADKFAEKGFTRVMGTIQEGPDKGKPAVVQTEEFLILEGKFAGGNTKTILHTENRDGLVTKVSMRISKSSFENLYPSIWEKASEQLIKDYGQPDITYNALTDASPINNSGTILLKYWEKKDGNICLKFDEDNSIFIFIKDFHSSPSR